MMSTSQPREKAVTTIMLDKTDVTRRYPFAQITIDQIKELRAHEEEKLKTETGDDYQVPAPIIIAQAVSLLHTQTFPKE